MPGLDTVRTLAGAHVRSPPRLGSRHALDREPVALAELGQGVPRAVPNAHLPIPAKDLNQDQNSPRGGVLLESDDLSLEPLVRHLSLSRDWGRRVGQGGQQQADRAVLLAHRLWSQRAIGFLVVARLARPF